MNSLSLSSAIVFGIILAGPVTRQAIGQQRTDDWLMELRERVAGDMRSGDYARAIDGLQSLIASSPDEVSLHLRLGDARFMNGQVAQAVASYDRAIELQPDAGPGCWQRGLALYYTNQFQAGREQFEAHQTVNRRDVENAVWHMLCVARIEGVEKARAQLIPIAGDRRVPMAEIYHLFAGTGTVDDVMNAASGPEGTSDEIRRLQTYYARLYTGLYYEMMSEPERSLTAIRKAVADNPVPRSQLMGRVADVHLQLRTSENR